MNTYFSAPSHRPYYAIMVISSVTDLRSRSRYANQIAQTNLYYNICLPAAHSSADGGKAATGPPE